MANKEISAQYDRWLQEKKRATNASQLESSMQKQQKINATARNVLGRYEEKIQAGAYMSPDEIDTYNLAVDMFEKSGSTLRNLYRAVGNTSAAGDNKAWEEDVYNLRGRAMQVEKLYSDYDSEDAWNAHTAELKEYEDSLVFDVNAGRQELYELEKQIGDAKKEQDMLFNVTRSPIPLEGYGEGASEENKRKHQGFLQDVSYLYQKYGQNEYDTLEDFFYSEIRDAAGANIPAWDHLTELENAYKEKDQYIKQAEHNQKVKAFEDQVFALDEFENAGRYVQRLAREDHGTERGDPFAVPTEQEYMNAFYEAVNQRPGAAMRYRNMTQALGEGSDFYAHAASKPEVAELTEDEIAVFNALAAIEGDAAAMEYYNLITTDLTARRQARNAAKAAAFAKENPFPADVVSVLSAPLKGFSYIAQGVDYLTTGEIDENAAYNDIPNISTSIRATRGASISGDWERVLGENWGRVGEFGYQLGMSMADFLVTAAVSGGNEAMSLAIMGTGAAADMTIAAKQRGLDDGQALALGTIAGAAEVVSERIGWDALFNTALKNKSTVLYLLKNALSEGFEEPTSSVINTMADLVISGDQAELRKEVQEYVSQGIDLNEAWGKAMGNYAASLGLDAVGGLLSGVGMGGGSVAISSVANTAAKNKAYKSIGDGILMDGNVEALQTVLKDIAGNKSASRKASAKNIGKLYIKAAETIREQTKADLTAALEKSGVSNKISGEVAATLSKVAIGEPLSERETELAPTYLQSEKIFSVYDDVILNPESATGKRLTSFAEVMQKKRTSDTNTENTAPAAQERFVENMEEATESVGDGDFLKSSGEAVDTVQVAEINGKDVTVTVNGKTNVPLGDVSFAKERTAVAYQYVTGAAGMTPTAANMIMSNPKASDTKFINEALRAFQSGVHNDMKVAEKLDYDVISPNEARALFDEGQKAAEAQVTARDAEVKAKQKTATEDGSAAERKGGVFYEYDGKTIKQRNDGKHKPLTKKQRVAVNFTERLAKKFGSTVFFYESYEENGKRMYKDRDGNIREAKEGFYDPSDGSIHVDLNGDNILFTVSHELVHFIKDWSPVQFKKMADLVMKGFNRQGLTAEELIEAKQKDYAEDGITLTEEQAFEEVIAASLEGIMADGRVMELLQAAEAKDKRLGAKLRQFFQNVKDLIRDTISSYKDAVPGSPEGRLIRKLEDIYSQLQEAFAEGVIDAGENFQNAENTTGDGGVRYMSRNIEDVTKDTVKQDLTDVFNGNNVSSGSYIPLLKSTPFAVRYITGYKIDRPVIVDKKKSYFDMRVDGKFKEDRSHHYHGMGIDGFIDALEILDDPEFVIQEEMDDGKLHYAFISTNENGEEVCVVFQMNVSKSPSQMNGYAGGYYNLDITEFVATDEWLEDHGAEPGMSYKDYLLSFPENCIAYDRSIHFEQLEKARNIDSGSAGLAASHINNRASGNKVPQPKTVVKKNSTTDSDGNQLTAEKDGIRASIGSKTDGAVQKLLERENDALREDVARLKELLKLQGTETHGTRFTPSSVEAAARYLKKNAGAKGDTKALAKLLNGFYEHIAKTKELTWEDVREQATPIANWLMDHVEHNRSDYAQEVLDQIHGSRVYLDESQTAEAAYRFESYDAFRRSIAGAITISRNADMSLDVWWQEMSTLYPDIFSADTTASDMPGELFNIVNRLRNENSSALEYEHNRRWIQQDLIRDIYDSYWRVNNLRTVADRNAAQINRLKSLHAQRMNKMKADNRQQIEQLKEQHKAEVKAYRDAYRQNMETQRKEMVEKYRQSRKDAVERVRETAEKQAARKKLQKLVIDTAKWLSHPAKTDVKCPDLLKKPYADFLNGIDMSSQRLENGGDPTKNDLRLANAMNSLATALERIVAGQDPEQKDVDALDSGYLDIPAQFVEELKDMATKITDMMVDGKYVVNSMTAAEVRQLSRMIRTLNHAIKTMSALYANLRFSNIEALGVDTVRFINDLGEFEKSGGIKDFVQWENGLPYYVFKRFGTGGESVFESLMDGQDKLAFHAKRLFDFQKKTWTEKESKEWSEDVHTVNLSNGGKLTLTTADAMSIYCMSRRKIEGRDHGLQHLLGGGVRVIGLQKGSQKTKDSSSNLTIADVEAINSSLTARQKQVANAIQQFMSTVCAEWGNEISMKRFLTKDFTEEFYFPIESNDKNMTVQDSSKQQSDLFRLLHISATKPTTPKANNEVIIRNIFDVFTGHASDMARMNAFGMPLLDYMKWLNYRQKSVNEAGQVTVIGVRKSMQKAYGDAAEKYALNLIKDVNGRKSEDASWLLIMYSKLNARAKTAMVGNNLRVATLQITSYPRAALVLSPKSLALGLSKVPNIRRAQKYCGIALWKSFGFYDTDIARSIEDQIKGKRDIRQKLIEFSLKGAELGDAITWGALWNACEYEVAATKDYQVGSEEFYQAVAKKLREVVYRTQVVDSILTRSEAMRSKSAKAKELTAFMSEPTLSANILMDAGFTFSMEKRRTGSAKEAWKNVGSRVRRAIAVYSVGQIAAALVEAVWDTVRSDDDEEKWKIYLKALGENLVLDLLPFNKIPIISDLAEAVLSLLGMGYYSTDSIASTGVSQAISSLKKWLNFFNDKTSDDQSVYKAIYKTIQAVSSLTGVAGASALRDLVALWNSIIGEIDEDLIIK